MDVFNSLNAVLPFWKLLARASTIEILEILACLILALNVESVLPLDALRRQIPSTVILIFFCIHGSVLRDSILIRSNEMQKHTGVYLL